MMNWGFSLGDVVEIILLFILLLNQQDYHSKDSQPDPTER